MQKLAYDKEFLSFILQLICESGGTRMQVTISDITKAMQSHRDQLDLANLHRKQYGNTEGALKALKNPCYILDNSVVKMKDRDSIHMLYKNNIISKEDYNLYVKKYDENSLKIIDVMRINKQNKCKVLYKIYESVNFMIF